MNTSAQPPFIIFTKALVADVDSSGQKIYEIDCGHLTNEQDLIDEFAKIFSFPDYFGGNWNAWWDCMTDLSEEYQTSTVVLLKEFDVLTEKLSKEEINHFLVLLRDVSVFWAIPVEGDDRYIDHSSISFKYILSCNDLSTAEDAFDEKVIGSSYFEIVE